MKSNVEHILILFHDRAGEVMLSLYRSFRQATASLDRQGDENVFQQQQGMYTALLKRRLDGIALEVMSHLEAGADHHECHHALSRFIGDYVQEFLQKIRSL